MNKENKNNGKKKLIITMAVALILLVGVTVSYGYIAILGNSKNQEVSVGTGDIHLVFDDADTSNVNATLKLGESITKTFKIENKGTKPGKVQINWKNLVNTYNSRSLSYTLETSSSKDTGYTSVEALRENVPVSTEAKEVPLSKEITIPVQSAPIYYRVTITFNNLSDVDQSGDVNATLTTQFSLSEPENLSKKVIAVLNGNVNTNDPVLAVSAPYYVRGSYKGEESTRTITNAMTERYVVYGDSYALTPTGLMYITNPKTGLYKDVYSNLVGKYMDISFRSSAVTISNIDRYTVSSANLVNSATLTEIKQERIVKDQKYIESNFVAEVDWEYEFSASDTIIYADSYAYQEVGGTYSLVNPQTCTFSECYQNLVGKYTLQFYCNQDASCDYISRITSTTSSTALFDTASGKESPVVDYSTTGVYKMDDDYGDSYYYRGGVTNNNVRFAGKNWKIIRVNGDGSIRMILNEQDSNNPEWVSFNTTLNDIKYVGYMFGGSSEDATSTSPEDAFTNKYDSNVKKVVDAWYESNLSSYASYISDTLFCNDREIDSSTTKSDGEVVTHFRPDKRLDSHFDVPVLTCKQKNDRFTVDDETIGNGNLKYPIGIITADEIALAGLPVFNDTDFVEKTYLGKLRTLTMSPTIFQSATTTGAAFWTRSQSWDGIKSASNEYSGPMLPVINIKPEYALKMVGNGTETDPFIIPGVN